MKDDEEKIFCVKCNSFRSGINISRDYYAHCINETCYTDTPIARLDKRFRDYNHVDMNLNNKCQHYEPIPEPVKKKNIFYDLYKNWRLS